MYNLLLSFQGNHVVFIAGGSDDIGFDYQYDVDVKDLRDANSVCNAIPDVSLASLFVTANTVSGKPVFCGGDLTIQDCYIFNSENLHWDYFAPLLNNRSTHTSVQLSDDSFWLQGNVEKEDYRKPNLH